MQTFLLRLLFILNSEGNGRENYRFETRGDDEEGEEGDSEAKTKRVSSVDLQQKGDKRKKNR